MRRLRAWCLRFAELFRKEQRDRGLVEELESHVQMHIEDNLRPGMNPAEARKQALIKLGGIEQAKEKYRDRRGVPQLETLLQHVRFGLRMVRKTPGFTAVVVLTLALGIGENTAIFSVACATLLAPLPYRQADRFVNVWSKLQGRRNNVSAGDFTDWKRQHRFRGPEHLEPGRFQYRHPRQAQRHRRYGSHTRLPQNVGISPIPWPQFPPRGRKARERASRDLRAPFMASSRCGPQNDWPDDANQPRALYGGGRAGILQIVGIGN
jgi:hypothetical protein